MRIMKLYKTTKDPELYYYFNSKDEKLFMFRHKYYEELTGIRKEKKKSGFKTEKAALKALLEVKAQTLRGETKSLENDNLTVGEWLDIWFETNYKKWKPSTVALRELTIRLHLKPLIGEIKLKKLDKFVYQKQFLDKIEGKLEPSTIRNNHVILSVAINAAVDEEILLRNKIKGAALPKNNEKQSKVNFLSPKQLNLFLKTAEENLDITNYTLFHLLAYTGMRKGEAFGLQWKNVDFKNRTIKIEKQRGVHGVGTTKTKKSERLIKVDDIVITQLKNYYTALKPILLKFGKKIEPTTFIFLSLYSGKPVPTSRNNDNFNKIIRLAKLPKITVHGLRHTHATILLNNGIPTKAIADRLGNSPEMIYAVYGHVLKELEDKTVNVFSGALQQGGANSGATS